MQTIHPIICKYHKSDRISCETVLAVRIIEQRIRDANLWIYYHMDRVEICTWNAFVLAAIKHAEFLSVELDAY